MCDLSSGGSVDPAQEGKRLRSVVVNTECGQWMYAVVKVQSKNLYMDGRRVLSRWCSVSLVWSAHSSEGPGGSSTSSSSRANRAMSHRLPVHAGMPDDELPGSAPVVVEEAV